LSVPLTELSSSVAAAAAAAALEDFSSPSAAHFFDVEALLLMPSCASQRAMDCY
jgi:hypothetical protein